MLQQNSNCTAKAPAFCFYSLAAVSVVFLKTRGNFFFFRTKAPKILCSVCQKMLLLQKISTPHFYHSKVSLLVNYHQRCTPVNCSLWTQMDGHNQNRKREAAAASAPFHQGWILHFTPPSPWLTNCGWLTLIMLQCMMGKWPSNRWKVGRKCRLKWPGEERLLKVKGRP